MRRSLCLSLLAALLASALIADGADGHPGATPPCGGKGTKTLAASASGRIFARSARDYAPVYGCLHRRGRWIRLGRYRECFDSSAVTQPRLAGRFAAYALAFCHRAPTASAEIVVKDLRTGRTLRRLAAYTGTPRGTPPLYSVTDLELSRGGSVAWIVLSTQGPRRIEVRRAAAGGANTLLDSGPDIQLDSLAKSGSWLYWTKAGRPRSAMLGS